ncbi:MAG: DNA-directed RNA polymerase subunit H [Candidatus Micrarchaeia archaeon]
MPEEPSILDHSLVPKHEILTKSEEERLLAEFSVPKSALPKISADDPVAKAIGAKEGDVLRITRVDETGKNFYYRVVVKA